jgi:Cu(I)/Ag(I) efflux system membrane fusion protein
MRLVPAGSLSTADTAPTRIRRSVDHITEHYLAMRRLFASDTEAGLGANALGVAQATEALLEQVDLNEVELDKPTRDAVTRIRRSALKMTGRDLTTDRAHFAELSEGFDRLLDAYRPDRERWEKLTVYRCPMAKARWIQFDDDMGNPYYGSQMLKCGDVQGVK